MNRLIEKRFIIMTIIIFASLSSCVNLAKRFKSQKTIWVSTVDATKYVEVQAETFNTVEQVKISTPPKDIFSLSSEGQAELIKTLGSKVTTVDDLINSLTKKLSNENISNTKVRVFPTKISKSIVFSVDRLWAAEGYTPNGRIINRIGDRLTNLEVSLNIPVASQMQFNSWDKFVSDWVTVDLGKVASSQQWSATGNLSYNAATKLSNSEKSTTGNTTSSKKGKADINQSEATDGTTGGNEKNKGGEVSAGLGGSASVNFTDKYETSLNLLLQRMKLSGTLAEQKMTLRQEGAFGVDLSGNTSVSFDIAFNGDYATPISIYKVNSYYNSGVAIPSTTINKSIIMWIFPNIPTNVIAILQYKYLYRHVREFSKKHIPEARQRVKHYYGEVGYGALTSASYVAPVNVTLVKPEDFKPITYCVGGLNLGVLTYIQWDGSIVNFETASEAAAFLEYIKSLSNTTRAYGTISGIPTDNNLNGFTVIKHQN